MGFFSKFANTVLPAAATALPFVLSGGTINPLAAKFGLAGAGVLASAVGAGAKGLAGAEAKDRQKKGRKRQRRDVNQANLVSALTRGKVNPFIADRTPSAGFIEKAAGGVSQGAEIGGAALTAADVLKRRQAVDDVLIDDDDPTTPFTETQEESPSHPPLDLEDIDTANNIRMGLELVDRGALTEAFGAEGGATPQIAPGRASSPMQPTARPFNFSRTIEPRPALPFGAVPGRPRPGIESTGATRLPMERQDLMDEPQIYRPAEAHASDIEIDNSSPTDFPSLPSHTLRAQDQNLSNEMADLLGGGQGRTSQRPMDPISDLSPYAGMEEGHLSDIEVDQPGDLDFGPITRPPTAKPLPKPPVWVKTPRDYHEWKQTQLRDRQHFSSPWGSGAVLEAGS